MQSIKQPTTQSTSKFSTQQSDQSASTFSPSYSQSSSDTSNTDTSSSASTPASPRRGSTLILTGAFAALDPAACSGMVSYALSKAATHALAQSMVGSALPKGAEAVCILPRTIDTPANRAGMPHNSSWTPVSHIAQQVLALCDPDAQQEKADVALFPRERLPATGGAMLEAITTDTHTFFRLNKAQQTQQQTQQSGT
jgi:NAD(P)-dependent dehydrogenase (short-subunit alcohol dehydrogenase family)